MADKNQTKPKPLSEKVVRDMEEYHELKREKHSKLLLTAKLKGHKYKKLREFE